MTTQTLRAPRRRPSAHARPEKSRGNLAARVAARAGSGVAQALIILIGLVWLVPTAGLFVVSLRSPTDNANHGWWTVFSDPAQLTLRNYQTMLHNQTITQGFVNTILITVPTTVLVVTVAALAAYAFAWVEFPGRDWLFLGVIGMLVVPIQMGFIPVARLYARLHLFGTIPGVVLFHTAFGLPFAIFLLRNYFAGIPKELLEATRLDGGSEWTIFRRVVLPLGRPALASLTIFQFLWVWNDLLVALIFAKPSSQPITVAIQQQTRQFGSSLDIISTGSFLSLTVPLIVFFSFQRFFVQGVLAGSVK
jgi:alpha-glucoside transport system permease protein